MKKIQFKKRGMDHRGTSFKMMNWSFSRIIFITLLLFTVYLLVTSTIRYQLNVSELQNLIITKKLLNSPDSFTYTDPVTLRTYPGIIDLGKFSTENLENTFNVESINVAVKLELTDLENNVAYEAYLNKKWYDRWSPISSFDKYDSIIDKRYVLIKVDNGFHKGLLKMNVVVSNA